MDGAERLVNLNTVQSADQLLPLLEPFPNREERELVAQKTFDYLESVRPVRNVGALAGLRVTADEIESDRVGTLFVNVCALNPTRAGSRCCRSRN